MPTLVACLWQRVEAMQPCRVPTQFGPATRLRRPESQWNQGALATSQVEMCPRTANSGLGAVRADVAGGAAPAGAALHGRVAGAGQPAQAGARAATEPGKDRTVRK